jgi:hypothetical protein
MQGTTFDPFASVTARLAFEQYALALLQDPIGQGHKRQRKATPAAAALQALPTAGPRRRSARNAH